MSALCNYLKELKNRDNRGALADLRCALIESRRDRAWPLLASFGGIGEGYSAQVVQTIAGMFAHHPQTTDVGNLGDTCRSLMSEDEREEYLKERKIGAMARRFQHILAASSDEICGRVARLVLFAKAKEKPVNYDQLENDLHYWSDAVRVRWAKSFWQAEEKEEETP
jgi:CRISPR system Cascade subunit CasB